MTEQNPGDLNQFDAKLKAARERIGESDSGDLAREGTSLGYGFRLSIELLAGLLVGLGMGYVIDGWLGTRPWLMLVFMILGLGGGILDVFLDLCRQSLNLFIYMQPRPHQFKHQGPCQRSDDGSEKHPERKNHKIGKH